MIAGLLSESKRVHLRLISEGQMAFIQTTKKALNTAWAACVERYNQQEINSERSMQAALWLALNNSLADGHKIFIEPAIRLPEGRTIRPDLVICNPRHVVGVVEIKYLPRGRAAAAEDIQKLCDIAAASDVKVTHDRYKGPKTKTLPLAVHANTVYAWAAITAHAPDTSWFDVHPGRFVPLIAVTSSDEDAFVPRYSRARS